MTASPKNCSSTLLCFFLLTALVSLAAATLTHHLLNRYEKLLTCITLEIDMEASEPGRWELFWDTGTGFSASESDSFDVRIPNLRSTGSFRLPNQEIRQLRLDPLDRPGIGTIYSIRITNGLGESLSTTTTKGWQLNPLHGIASIEENLSGIRIKSVSDDPHALLQLDLNLLNSLLTSEMRFHPTRILSLSIAVFGISMLGFVLLGNWMLPILLSLALWGIVYPGSFSPDSISHLYEASVNHYYNWHPAILAILLRAFSAIGITPALVILAQTLLGMLGVFSLVREVYAVIRKKTIICRYDLSLLSISLLIFVFLFSPFTPFTGFLTTLWKDVTFSICLLWITSLSIALLRLRVRHQSPVLQFILLLILTLLLMFSLLVRGNAIVMLPLYLGLIWIVSNPCKLWIRLGCIVFVLLAPTITQSMLSRHFVIRDANPKGSVMALELAGILYLRPELESEFPYVAQHLKPGWQKHFHWAAYRYMRFGDNAYAKSDLVKAAPNPKLNRAYFRAMRSHPLLLSYVKLRNFCELINPLNSTEWFPFEIAQNDFGLKRNRYAAHLHLSFRKLSWEVISHPVLRWISGVHLLWQGLAFAGFIVLLKARMKGNAIALTNLFLVLSLIPLAYTASYLLACPWIAFRYIYPGTLLIQVTLLSAGLSWGIHTCRNTLRSGSTRSTSRKE
ncbi:MAG: hypothetical protein ABQ298_01060 [Puniceicoccaceae bacterium]